VEKPMALGKPGALQHGRMHHLNLWTLKAPISGQR
jgi:hypothetical protein